MKLWLISQDVNNGWDTFDSAVVAAKTKKKAQNIHPGDGEDGLDPDDMGSWVSIPSSVNVEYIGEAKEGTKAGVICASFNAG